MVKFVAKTGDGRNLITLGLSEVNIEKLKQGLPILVDGKDLGIPNILVNVMYGKTERDIYDELKAAGVEIKHGVFDIRTIKK